MNNISKVVWSHVHQQFVVVSEIASSVGKAKSTRTSTASASRIAAGAAAFRTQLQHLSLAVACAVLAPAAWAQTPEALPTGGRVVAGQGSIQTQGHTMTVNQGSQRMALDWQSFNIGAGQTVNFVQPNAQAVALNRVLGSDVSTIQGQINANGRVYLLNPNGILFTPSAQVNVGGLVASTLGMTNADFMAGNDRLAGDSTGAVINQGQIRTAQGGTVALVAAKVTNAGDISAPSGAVWMAAGRKVRLDLGGPAQIEVEEGALDALIEQTGSIRAADGMVYLTAKAASQLNGSAINHSGLIEAGSIDAKGGLVTLEADRIHLTGSSRIDATGAKGGGTVLIGGDWQGSGSLRQATTVTMDAGSVIDASATESGNGGKVVLWSDVHNANSVTTASGAIYAKGGSQGGDGGKVETSGHALEMNGFQVDTRSANAQAGKTGLWLIDPYDYTIGTAEASTITAALGASNVTVTTTADVSGQGSNGNSAGNGDITINAALNSSSANSLTLTAARNISLASGHDVTLGGGLTLHAGGTIALASNVTTTGAQIYNGQVSATGDRALSASKLWINGGLTSTGNLSLIASSGDAVIMGNVTTPGSFSATANSGSFVMGVNLLSTDLNSKGATISADGGVTIAAGTSYLAGHVTTANTAISITGDVKVANFGTDPLTLYSGNGNITLTGGTVGRFEAAGDAGTTAGQVGKVLDYAVLVAKKAKNVTGSSVAISGYYDAATPTTGYLLYQFGTVGDDAFYNPFRVTAADYIVTAGGGGGGGSVIGANTGGGGGGGGVADGALVLAAGVVKSVTVGSGGIAGASSTISGTTGGDSKLDDIWAGGGGGGGASGVSGASGGAGLVGRGGVGYTAGGGGGGNGFYASSAIVSGGTGTQRNGGSSGVKPSGESAGQAGGGAVGSGNSTAQQWGGTGGAGFTSSITGSSVEYGKGANVYNDGAAPMAIVPGAGGTAVYSGGSGTGAGNGVNGAVILRHEVGNAAQASGAALKLVSGTGTTSISSHVSNLSSLEVNTTAASTLSGNISGTGSTLTNSGSGVLTVTGNATYTGLTTVTSSSVVFTNNSTPGTSGFAGAGTVTIQPDSSFASAYARQYTFASTLTGLTIGKAGNTAAININASNAALAINGPIRAYSSGGVTQTSAIVATSLALYGNSRSGNFTLENDGNNIGTLAASDVGNLSYLDSNALTIGTVGSTDGIEASGTVAIQTLTGDLTLAKNVGTTNTSVDAVVLNAARSADISSAPPAVGADTAGNVIISSGVNVVMGSGARAVIYSGSTSNSTGLSALAGNNNLRYGSDETTTRFNTTTRGITASGTYAIYREAPAAGGTIVYGDAVPNGVTVTTPSYAFGSTLNAGLYAISGGGDANLADLGYSAGLLVNQRPITITANSGQTKVYGAADPALAFTLEPPSTGRGLIGSDTLSGALSRVTGENVGSAYAISLGTLANSNYAISFTGANFAITPRSIEVSGLTAQNKTYDGTTVASLTGTASVTALGSDAVSVTGTAVGAFADKNAGVGKVVTVSGLQLTGADAGNYSVLMPGGLTASINKSPLSLAIDAQNKRSGDPDPTWRYQILSGSLLNGDALTLSRPAGEAPGKYLISAANPNYQISAADAYLSIANRMETASVVNGVLTVAPVQPAAQATSSPVLATPSASVSASVRPASVSPAAQVSSGLMMIPVAADQAKAMEFAQAPASESGQGAAQAAAAGLLQSAQSLGYTGVLVVEGGVRLPDGVR